MLIRVDDKFRRLTVRERVKKARKKIERVVDNLHYLLALHEHNKIVLYSSTLSSQIPTSYAANAFNVFQRALHQFEIVRLCASWDGVAEEKENIPTIIELVDNGDVIETLAQETASHWAGDVGCLLNPSANPDLHALEIDVLKRSNERFGMEQADRARMELHKVINASRVILSSERLEGIMNLRHKHLAHSFSQTRREKDGPIAAMKFRDEGDVLNDTMPIVEALHCWVTGCSFSLEESRETDRHNAEALWNACTFNVVT